MKSAVTNKDGELDLMPLYMSLIAGMSTCLGAVWVLFQRRPANGRQKSTEPVIRPSTMCFSLALAASVMITVSVVSIIPECLREEEEDDADLEEYHMISIFSSKFVIRLIFHIVGYVLYFLLAKFAFPEPDEILGLSPQDGSHSLELLETQELIRTTSSDSTPSKDPQHSSGARNRRLNSVNSLNDLNNSPEEQQQQQQQQQPLLLPEEEEEGTTKDNPSKKKPDFLRTLSTFSTGADLETHESKRAWRVAMLLFLSLSVHNFPEGLAVAASTIESRKLGLKVTIGILVHNIPEGVSIAVPCIAARPDSPWLAFWLSALSGLAEPFGAFVALFALRKFEGNESQLSPAIFNMENVLAFVAGIMIMVAVAELWPEALRHTKEGKGPFIAGNLAGMILMLATELYLA